MKPRLLLIDDDPGTIHVLHRLLGQEHELRYALDGETALAMAAESPPDLVLLDAQMPGMSGTEVCRRLKSDPRTALVPVLFVTSVEEVGAELMSLELGAAGVVPKPLDAARLQAAIRGVLEPPRAALPADLREAAGGDADGRRCLLIVDDDPSAVQAIHAALAGLDARFLFATDGAQALELARQARPDVVLLDLYMPGLDGLEVLAALKAEPVLAQTEVVIVTRYAFPEMERRALDGGGVDFIAKPYTQAVLQARVRNVLRLQEQAKAQRQAEREHWQRIGNARLARVVAGASDAIVTADARGDVVLINAAACRLFGVDAAYVIGLPLARLAPGVVELGLQGGSIHRRRLELTHTDGHRFPAELSFSQLGEGDDRLTTVILRDLSEQERADAAERARLQAEAALKAKTMMLSYLAHEIGNPLNGILGLTRLLQTDERHPLPPSQHKLVQHLADTGMHLQALMRDVLDLHRLESGRFEMRPQALDAAEVAARALGAMRGEAVAAGVLLTLDAARGAGLCVRADETRLHQCLLNLLSNAIKYGREHGRVRLHVRADGERVAFDVEDEGEGLGIEQQEALFEPFSRLGRGGQGAGIGLALTRLLAEAMGGLVGLRSEPGQGSVFTLLLPAAPR